MLYFDCSFLFFPTQVYEGLKPSDKLEKTLDYRYFFLVKLIISF